jgi:hypothetical protein
MGLSRAPCPGQPCEHAWNLGIGAWRASIGTLQLSQLDNDTAAAISKFCTNLRRFEITWGSKLDYACICSDVRRRNYFRVEGLPKATGAGSGKRRLITGSAHRHRCVVPTALVVDTLLP